MLSERTDTGPITVQFPNGEFISPGRVVFQCRRVDVHEKWFCGYLVETTEEVVEFTETYIVPTPHPMQGSPEERRTNPGDCWCLYDRIYKVVSDDDITFWDGMTKEEWLLELKIRNIEGIARGELLGWWDVDEEGNPRKLAQKVSISEMQAQNKPLMAHLMVDLGFFPSVGQARKNGWDKPLELGRHELGPKKKRAFIDIVP